MDTQPPAPMPLTEFIRAVFLNDMKRMVYDANLHYLAFGTIAVGIEFLGACDDAHTFKTSGLSAKRFSLGIKRMARLDAMYSTYNQRDSPFCLYNYLRRGTAHVMRPAGPVLFSQRSHDDGGAEKHLDVIEGKLLLISEDFYDHFALCCETLIQELPGMTDPKLKSPYLWVGD